MTSRSRFAAVVLGCAGLVMVAALETEAYAVGHQMQFHTVVNHALARTWQDAWQNSRLTLVGLLLVFMLIGLLALGVVKLSEVVDRRADRAAARLRAARRALRRLRMRLGPDRRPRRPGRLDEELAGLLEREGADGGRP